jgi:hypothetical protein
MVWRTSLHEQDTPELFPGLSDFAGQIEPGTYKVLEGSGEEVIYRPHGLVLAADPKPEAFMPGVYKRGIYTGWHHEQKPVVSFLYHKQAEDGQLETTERTIILNGIGYGEHPGHKGQPATWYLVGPEVARINPETGEITNRVAEKSVGLASKNFSIACINNGPFGEPLLANSQK